MESIKDIKNRDDLRDNEIIGNPKLSNTTIAFTGKNNILVCEDNINIVNSFDGITDQGVIKAWDVSENSDSGVKAWLKVDSAVLPQLAEEESEIVLPHDVRCELFIGAEGGVKAPADMKGFFAEFENLEKIWDEYQVYEKTES